MIDLENPINLDGVHKMLEDALKHVKTETRQYVNTMLDKAAKGELEGGLSMEHVMRISNEIQRLENADSE